MQETFCLGMKIRCKAVDCEAIKVTDSNFLKIREFASGTYVTKADNPSIPRGKYFGVFVRTRYGRQLAYIGDYIVKLGDGQFRVVANDEIGGLFEIIKCEL